uniref:hypothetical protein n=1 Tax=Komagataeibacter europaeus TaxID=33995 RepID=UPI001F24022F|nr:hypothetical protein [Komagataeibacter europaeus]
MHAFFLQMIHCLLDDRTGYLFLPFWEAEPQLAVTLCWLRKMQNLLCKKEDTRKEGELKALLEEGKTTLLSRLIPALERDAAAIEASLVTPWT